MSHNLAKRRENEIEPVKSVDMVHEMVQQLRRRILGGTYGDDGEIPPEGELSRIFGVSRTVAREAMRTLRAQGLIEVSRGRRPRVKQLDPQVVIDSLQAMLVRSNATLEHLSQVRRSLEVEVAAIAAKKASPTEIEAMKGTIEELAAARTVNQRVAADTRFHCLLAEATHNPIFMLWLTTTSVLLEKSRRKTISRVGAGRAIEGHTAILKAVIAKNENAARQAMLLHLRMAEEDLFGPDTDS